MPIYHEVFAGNTAEAPTLEPTLKKVMARYPHIRRLVVVAASGLLSLDNIEAHSKLRLSDDQALEFILLLRPHEVSTGGIFDPWVLKEAHHPLG